MNKIIYLDAAASYLKPKAVIDTQVDFLTNGYANAGRGICKRASDVDLMVKNARECVADFIGTSSDNIVFTSGTTAGMNVVARMLNITSEMYIGVSDLDHHSARLPFVMTGANIIVCPLDDSLNINIEQIPNVDVLVITAMSNVVGVAQDVEKIINVAKQKNPNVITVVDAAQFVVHNKIDVQKWGCDFLCFSGHKIGADTGLGVLYIKNPDLYNPVVFGGGMVNKIIGSEVLFNSAPDVFEAGTLPLTQIAGIVPAIHDIALHRPNLQLIEYLYDELVVVDKVKIISERNSAVFSFVVEDMHVLDFGALIGARNVCVRVGNMCASWMHQYLGISGSIRISVGAYNTIDEIKQVIGFIKDIVK